MWIPSKLENNYLKRCCVCGAPQLEIGEGAELTEAYLSDELHPKQCLHRPKFSKPKGPANRGNKRLTKAPQDDWYSEEGEGSGRCTCL